MDFEEVYSRYAKDVYAYVFSLCGNHATTEDITSETFLKAIRASATFRGTCTVKVWLCQIAKNTYYDLVRKNSRAAELPADVLSEGDFELDLLSKAQAVNINKLLHRLSEPYKEVFSLRVFAELSFAEIGEVFEKSENWARVTFYRAKLKIREADTNGKM